MRTIKFFVCFFILSEQGLIAQQKAIVLKNIFSGKEIELKAGDEVHIRFTVHDTSDFPLDVAVSNVTVSGEIEEVKDSSIVLTSKTKTVDRVSFTIPVNSIEAFRKYNSLRPLLKAGVTIVTASSALLVSLQISSSDEIVSWGNAGLAVATTAAAYASRNLFSDKMKYYAVEGWRPAFIWKRSH
jgi:hypothetical protein